MVRGTIMEKVPNDRVEILLPNGQMRTLQMADVEYAGPAAGDPSAAPPPPPPSPTSGAAAPLESTGPSRTEIRAGTARLELKSDQAGLTFFRKNGTSQGTGAGWAGGFGTNKGGPVVVNVQLENFERLCTAPCSVDLPAGTYRLGLSLGDGEVIAAEPAVDARGQMRIRGNVESFAPVRTGGVLLVIAGAVAGTVIGLQTEQDCGVGPGYCFTTYPYFVHGAAILGITGIVGLLMALKKDEAHLN